MDARKCVDRLGHINSRNLIPGHLISKKRKVEVTAIVCEMLDDDEKVYGRLDKPVDNDWRYVALVSETAADRLSTSGHRPRRLFPMPGRIRLLEVRFSSKSWQKEWLKGYGLLYEECSKRSRTTLVPKNRRILYAVGIDTWIRTMFFSIRREIVSRRWCVKTNPECFCDIFFQTTD